MRFILLICLAFVPLSLQAQPLEKDVLYDPQHNLSATVFVPEHRNGLSHSRMALLIHGGGWAAGSRDEMFSTARLLQEHGVVAMSITYRLAPQHKWPAQYEDVTRAILWFKRNAAQWGGDPDKMVLIGASAGGHLAAFSGLNPRPGAQVQGIVSLWGPWDLTAPENDRQTNSVNTLLNTDTLQERQQASPLFHITPKAPPAVVVHGDRDEIVSFEKAQDICPAYDAVGVPCRFVPLHGEGHSPRNMTPAYRAISDLLWSL